MWQEIEIDSFSGFVERIRTLNPHWPNREQWIFRGQTDVGWSLQPSLLRIFADQGLAGEKFVGIEQDMRKAFGNEAHRFLPSHYLAEFESDLTHWWAVMRHYGSPTRILDWTLSPYVALYFAVEGLWADAGALWCVRGKAIGKSFGTKYPTLYKKTWKDERKKVKGNPFSAPMSEPMLYFYEMRPQIDRISAQQGRFTVCTDPLQDHGSVLEQHLANKDLLKFTIPAKCKPVFMRELHLMNITAKSLYPGIEGLGKSMEEIARLSIRFDRPAAPTDAGIE